MGFAFAHLLFPWITGKIYEFFSKHKISHYTWFFLLIGGILPDADFLLDWTLGTELHRTFSHSFFFVIAAPLLAYFIFYRHPEKKQFAIALGIGILTHLILDIIPGGPGIPLFWPWQMFFSTTHFGYYNPGLPSFLHQSPEILQQMLKNAVLDMALGTAWIFYLWWRKKVQF